MLPSDSLPPAFSLSLTVPRDRGDSEVSDDISSDLFVVVVVAFDLDMPLLDPPCLFALIFRASCELVPYFVFCPSPPSDVSLLPSSEPDPEVDPEPHFSVGDTTSAEEDEEDEPPEPELDEEPDVDDVDDRDADEGVVDDRDRVDVSWVLSVRGF